MFIEDLTEYTEPAGLFTIINPGATKGDLRRKFILEGITCIGEQSI